MMVNIPVHRRQLIGRPIPVLNKGQLSRQSCRPIHMQMRITPMSMGIDIFITDVVPTNPGRLAVNHHYFTMVSEVDPEAMQNPRPEVKRATCTRLAQSATIRS